MEPSQATTYASIMVPIDPGPETENRIKLAGWLADSFSSRLIGIAGQEIVLPPYAEGAVGMDSRVAEQEEGRVAATLAKAEALFRRVAAMRNNLEWRQAFTRPHGFVCQQARAADLIVVSRPDGSGMGSMDIDPGDLVMDLGRPMLLIPPGMDYLAAKRIVIAWKDTREARRAVADSLPFLQRAEEVFVLSLGASALDDAAADVSEHLRGHGIACRAFNRPESDETAADLIRLSNHQGADLIICGAYGHARAREWMFGGMTRDLIRTAPVPCLMSH